jgi:hypothetical protein
MWHLIRNQTAFSTTNIVPKNVESSDKTESSKPLKKSASMDSLKSKPINVKKRNVSIDGNVFSHGNWFISDKV